MTNTQSEIIDVLRGALNVKAWWTGKALRCSGRFCNRNIGFILTFENHQTLRNPRIKWSSPSRVSRAVAMDAIGTIATYTS